MRKVYSKPTLEIEVYEMSANIASNCGTTISLGPEAYDKPICSDFSSEENPGFGDDDDFEFFSLYTARSGGTPFYEDNSANCDCYYSSGGRGYFTS